MVENVRTVAVEDVFCLLLLFSCAAVSAAAEESSSVVAGWMSLLFSFDFLIFFVLPINFESRGKKYMVHVILWLH